MHEALHPTLRDTRITLKLGTAAIVIVTIISVVVSVVTDKVTGFSRLDAVETRSTANQKNIKDLEEKEELRYEKSQASIQIITNSLSRIEGALGIPAK